MAEIGIVIPTYNEKENITKLIEAIRNLGINSLNIVIVDDNSPDGTGKIAKNLNKHYGSIFVLQRSDKLGIGSAIIDGMKTILSKDCKYIVTLDADFSHDPKDIPRLLKETKHADLVQGSRYTDGGKIIGWSLYRKIMSYGGNLLCKVLFRTGVKEHTTYFRVYSRKLAKIIVENVKANGFEFAVLATLIAKDHGFRIKEVPITFVDRARGKSKLKTSSIIEWNLFVFKIFLSRLLKKFKVVKEKEGYRKKEKSNENGDFSK